MDKSAKIYVAGHRGMVGSAIVRELQNQGFNNIVTQTSKELDLKDQNDVVAFFQSEKPEYVFMAAAKVGGIHANNIYRAEFLYNKGFSVLDIQGLNLTKGIEFGKVTPEYWIQFAEEINHDEAEAIFLSCGGIRSTEVIEEIEKRVGKPVITSNQAQFWSCLRRAGVKDNLKGFGKLFDHQLTTS